MKLHHSHNLWSVIVTVEVPKVLDLKLGPVAAERLKLNIARVWKKKKKEGAKRGEGENNSDLPVSLKYWKPFFWDAVQHFLHPANAILHNHIRKSGVKEDLPNQTKRSFNKVNQL